MNQAQGSPNSTSQQGIAIAAGGPSGLRQPGSAGRPHGNCQRNNAAVDVQLALAGCHSVLKAGGTLVLNLPAYDVLRGRHHEAVSGVRRHRPARLRALLTKAGFEVITVHAWIAWLFSHAGPAAVEPAPPAGATGDLALTSPAFNRLLAPLGALDTRLSRWLGSPLGTALYAIALRP